MKKLAILLCCTMLLNVFTGCSAKKDNFIQPVHYYYEKADISYNSESGVIEKEIREGSSFQGNVTAFMHGYLRGPESDGLRSIIPSDVYLVSCIIEENTAHVILSSQFSKLTGIKLTAACSAMLLTLHDFVGIDTLSIRAKDSKLDDQDKIVLNIEDVVLIDKAEINE